MTDQPPIFQAIALSADHRGAALKDALRDSLQQDFFLTDFGTNDQASIDAMDYALLVVGAIKANPDSAGILICGSGHMMAMTANRFPFIRATICRTAAEAGYARDHNDANVLCLAADTLDPALATDIARKFLTTPASTVERYSRRRQKLAALDIHQFDSSR